MTLAEFLNARLAEDEAAAKAATPGPWMLADGREWLDRHVVFGGGTWPGHIQEVCNVDYAEHKEGNLVHIACNDPVRVLREVEAKRAILAEHRTLPPFTWCETCDDQTAPCRTLRLLAAVWSDHPDYDPAWKA